MVDIKEIAELIKKELELESTREIQAEDSSKSIEEWDSMGQMVLINSIEQKYNIRMNFEDFLEIGTVEDLVNIVNKKVKKHE